MKLVFLFYCAIYFLIHLSDGSVYPLTPSSLAPSWLDGSRGKSSEPMPGKEPSAWATAEFCEHLTIIFRHCSQGAHLQGRGEKKRRGREQNASQGGNEIYRLKRQKGKRKLDCHSDREPCAYVHIGATLTQTRTHTVSASPRWASHQASSAVTAILL